MSMVSNSSSLEQRVALDICASPQDIASLVPSKGLKMFRQAAQQQQALVEIATDTSCCVSIARCGGDMVGYAAFHHPSDVETWGDDKTGALIELGAIEVDPDYRGQDLAKRLLSESFAGGRFDDTIVIATMYVWHYDLKGNALSDFQYKRLLDRLYRSIGMEPYRTTDPEIRSNAANQLMARIGPNCPQAVRDEFDRLRSQKHAFCM